MGYSVLRLLDALASEKISWIFSFVYFGFQLYRRKINTNEARVSEFLVQQKHTRLRFGFVFALWVCNELRQSMKFSFGLGVV